MRSRYLLVPSCLVLTLVATACQDTPSDPPPSDVADSPRAEGRNGPPQAGPEGYQTRGERRTGYILGRNGRPRQISYEIQEGLAIWEGDIIVGRAGEIPTSPEALRKFRPRVPGQVAPGVYIDGGDRRWPGGVMPYEIDPAVADPSRITSAIAWIEQATAGVNIEPRSGQADYVRFVDGDGCASWIGRQGGQQGITLGGGCSVGNAAHEMLHALGMFHEQSRCDRDTYVQILTANVEEGRLGNFDKECDGATDFPLDVYDEASIMHYGPFFFSSNGQPTIQSLRGRDHLMGQRSQLSEVDVQTVNHLYGHHNQAPTAAIGALAAGYPEGSPVNFNGSGSSDPDDAVLQYSWNFGDGTCSGGSPPAKCTSVSPVHAFPDNGSYPVTLTVSDGTLTHTASATVVVTNVAPAVSAGPDATRNEGSTLSQAGTFTDPGADTWTATVNYGDGSGDQPLALSGKSFNLSHGYVDNGSYTVTVQVTDKDGGSGVDQVTVTVNNVAPVVDAGPNATLTSGGTLNLSGGFSDVGVADAPWSWVINWGFGDNTTGTTSDQAAPILASRQVCVAGTYSVALSVTDKDGGTGTDQMQLTVPYLAVAVDIRPGQTPNAINRRAPGVVPVAVLSSATFDARAVDPSRVVLGDEVGDDTPVARQTSGRYLTSVEDVNGDGLADLVLMFEIAALVAGGDLPETATALVLRGFLQNGCTNFRGTDAVVVVP